ncbi:hypothetical protein CRV08_10810 [Halarcobacter ebronensis]|uniref:Uncharacterized protein n=1 Tax=Halarcobacter ebronensis TaxID=1462615 RepID=A0A4Q0YEY4_9BACT|nr:hypothetical protein [Halarcobacter ebronensis]RXJ67411.1 hypothetical protein CRV08_10810 [Halarcobacter ebronensis]
MNKNFVILTLLTITIFGIIVFKFNQYEKNVIFANIEEFRKDDLFSDLNFKRLTHEKEKNVDIEIYANKKFSFDRAIKYFYIRENNNLKYPFKIVYMSLDYNENNIKKFIQISLKNSINKDYIIDSLDNIKKNFLMKDYEIRIFQNKSERFGFITEVHIYKKGKN